MLQELHIERYAIIDRADIQFGDGLNVITGETGAGKSLIVGAVKLVLGERGGSGKIAPGAKDMFISARFLPNEAAKKFLADFDPECEEIIISRRITAAGRSYFWVNGRPATADFVRELGDFLVDIHGQHAHQLLFKPSHHLDLLDEFAGTREIRAQLAEKFREWEKISREIEDLRARRDEILRQQRLVQFELEELTAADLSDPDEESQLEARLAEIESAEQILEFASKLSQGTVEGEGSIAEIAGILRADAEKLAHIPAVAETLEHFDTILAVCDELGRIAEKLARIEYDPAEAEQIRQRLTLLGELQRKYGKTLAELIQYRDQLAQRNIDDEGIDERIEHLEAQRRALEEKLSEIGGELSRRRQESAEKFASAVEEQLADLALENARFEVHFERTPDLNSPFQLDGKKFALTPAGFERAEFLFSANPGYPPQELRKIASGGELSRLALAIKLVMPTADLVACSVFDEIDAGIGGQTAIRVAEKLAELARGRQVIVISHLPPVARRADVHIKVEKTTRRDKTAISVARLDETAREEELRRMMALEGDVGAPTP
ncbi:DNA repair protein RecN [bacterium]|nr:DNA repair protein RecN [bacterium]